ncbi:hypothetical protein G7Z17_g10353 [Cylindrodendrum hubeiense]|uniref:Uncharacterized protein n=1 Tax=Cylindrodendrum hubeiense TaxID=595255 RepID=A0A9P5GZN6_9HYPO|nr:hypothetical protein G7Z17_g10353 [Cylindrodendrum hubeiense]
MEPWSQGSRASGLSLGVSEGSIPISPSPIWDSRRDALHGFQEEGGTYIAPPPQKRAGAYAIRNPPAPERPPGTNANVLFRPALRSTHRHTCTQAPKPKPKPRPQVRLPTPAPAPAPTLSPTPAPTHTPPTPTPPLATHGPRPTMTYSSSGPSLAQAPDADPPLPLSSSDSSSSSSSYSGSHSHSHSHSRSNSYPHARSSSGKRHAHLHRHDSRQVDTNQDDQDDQQLPSEKNDDYEPSIDTVSRLRHSHRRLQFRDAQTALKLDIRDDTATGYVTQVVQTVSVVQVVDSVGSPIAVQTLYGDTNTVVVDSASGSTVSASNPDTSTAAAPASNAASTDNVAQSSDDMTPLEATTPAADATTSDADPVIYSVPTPASSSDLLSSTYSVALDTLQDSAQTPGATIGTSINGSFNGTSSTPTADLSSSTSSQTTLTETSLDSTSVATSHTTSDVTSKSTSYSVMKNILSTSSTTSFTSSSISSFTSSSTTHSTTDTTDLSSTDLSSTIYSYSTETWTSTQYADGGGSGDGDATAASQPADSTTTSSANGSSSGGALSTTQKQVLGGVVGSIAGVAVLALLIMLAIKYKKRQSNLTLLGDSPPRSNAKGLITGGDSGNGSGGAMAERTGPFAVAAALAGLTGKRNNQTPEEANPTGERGFYRVSGKKLPSVLQTGGDGYSDPRDSVASGHTDYWRGSQAFNPSDGGSNRLALGSPMRPVSGVPIIRTGPARTPVKEENPFVDPISRPRPDSDALGDSIGGGSITSQDGSWGSPSRFKERI